MLRSQRIIASILCLCTVVGHQGGAPLYAGVIEELKTMIHPDNTSKKSNHLGSEKSPYLLQHKDNPVNWYAWGEKAFEAARKENKIIFLSIGYSTCHWCHVMEHDSFEKQEVADLLNKHFISIKVDREERPDVDAIYMDAVMMMTGNGGWPMSVFLTPDLKPVFGGTFFWKDQFMALLNRIQEVWEKEPEKIKNSGEQLMPYLKGQKEGIASFQMDLDALRQAFSIFHDSFDATYGGFGRAPKFPRSTDLSLLLRIYRRTQNKDALKMVTVTLDNMARGGIYDHLGGGFHRYSTDTLWLTPHFEKMLYDNALLAWTYLEGYQVTGNKMVADVARQTLDYVLRDMTSPEGGFYSAEDADSEGEEGKFHVWTQEELKKLLTKEESELLAKTYGVTAKGNFEHGTNILHLASGQPWETKSNPILQSAHKKLWEARKKRIHPGKDDKILTEWNGLMMAAMAKGYQVLGEERYLRAAEKAAQFIKDKMYNVGANLVFAPGRSQGSPLRRRYREGEARFDAFQTDYAALIFGLLHLYEAGFDPQWISWAESLSAKQDELFWDSKEGGYFFAKADSKDLIVRKKEFNDGATPSGNSLAVWNLLTLHHLTFEKSYLEKAEKLFEVLSVPVSRYPPGYSMALIALDFYLDQSKEVAVVGAAPSAEWGEMKKYLQQTFLPNIVVGVGDGTTKEPPLLANRPMKDGKPTFYVCSGGTCKAPTNSIEEAKKLISTFEPYEL